MYFSKKLNFMKNKLFLSFLFVASFLQAQIKIPQASPLSKVEQIVGLTTIDISYSRPSAKGRPVYGELVPYGKNWRTGANENTTISFSEDVIIGGKLLLRGKYALYTTPKADSWDIIFYKDTNNWGLPEDWNENEVALRTTILPESLSKHVETFTIAINNVTTDSATLDISWEKTLVSVKIEVTTQKAVVKNINQALQGPTSNDFFTSAQYYYQSNNDFNKALEWINKAISISKEPEVPFWYYRLKSLIQYKLGDIKGALETAKLSLAGATKANNQDYIKQNNDSINSWSKMKN